MAFFNASGSAGGVPSSQRAVGQERGRAPYTAITRRNGGRTPDIRLDFEAAALRLAEHPDQRDVGQRVIGVTAADVGMDTGEPHLADLLIGDVTLLVRIELRRRNDFFVP